MATAGEEVRFVKHETWRRKVRAWKRERPPQVRLLRSREQSLPPNPFRAAEILIREGQRQATLIRY